MNEITQLLATPLPLGLMVVFFFVALAVFSLYLARVESRHRSVQANYLEQLYALRRAGAPHWAAGYHDAAPPSSGGGWMGWMMAVGVVAAAGVGLLWTQRPGAPELVIPEIAHLPVSPEPAAIEPPVPLDAPKLAPKGASLSASTVSVQEQASPNPRARLPEPRQPLANGSPEATNKARRPGPDADIDRMLAWERQRTAARRHLNRPAKRGRASRPKMAGLAPQKASSPVLEPQGPSAAAATKRAKKRRPSVPPAQADSQDDVLLPKPAPRKRRRLKLNASDDPMGF